MHEAWPLIREIGQTMRAGAMRSAVLAHAVLCVAVLESDVAAQAVETTASVAADACASADTPRVELDDALNKVAREISYDTPLNDAMQRIGYQAEKSTSLYVKGPTDDSVVEAVIADRYCIGVRDEGYTEIGAYHVHLETWIVLARPIARPAIENAPAIEARVLELVNAARAQSRRCGDRQLTAAAPLTLSELLTVAAARHARDMALHASFDHMGSDGSQSSKRVTEAGFRWRSTGENIAAGQRTPETVVAAWLESPEHCANLMNAAFTEMGVAFAPAPLAMPDIYWTQVFGTPL